MSRLAHRDLDRFEQENGEFFQRVRDGFHAMAANDPQHWVIIEAVGDPDAIEQAVRAAVIERLGI
jgi:dTMP kinase